MNKQEYDEIFMDECNKIFPKGAEVHIQEIRDFFEKCGVLEDYQRVCSRAMKILEEGLEKNK